MLGLYGLLNLGARSLQTQRQGVEVAGQNMANVNNPAYARQRLKLSSAPTIAGENGLQGTGVQSDGVEQLRNSMLDMQIVSEASVRGALESRQSGLQLAQANLGQLIDRQASGPEGAAAASGVGGEQNISKGLSDLFSALQSLSTDPSSMTQRNLVLMKAADLASRFTQTNQRLDGLSDNLDQSLAADVSKTNQLLSDIAKLNDQISNAEISTSGMASDLRDTREAKIEELAKLTTITVTNASGADVGISIGGVQMVQGKNLLDTLETYDAGGGQMLVRTVTGAAPLSITGGSMNGTIQARDEDVKGMQDSLNTLAANLITQLNTIHQTGYSLTGSNNNLFFSGSNAADISVNAALTANPALIQASGTSGASGNNGVVVQMAQLETKSITALGGLTLSGKFAQITATVGQSLSSVNGHLTDQTVVDHMLLKQRDSYSGVSLDEEMTDLTRFQKAFSASAKLITTVDEMLDTVIGMKR